MDSDLTRRELIKLGAAAAIAASIGSEPAASQSSRAFFTSDELALVDELSELMIPTDGHSPGARTAGVAAYIDARLAEAWDPADRDTWREGLASIERLSQQTTGAPFLQTTLDQRVAVLSRLAANEKSPQSADDRFFVELKSRVIDAYYSSEIGIKQEMEYKGNVPQAEFSGIDVSRD